MSNLHFTNSNSIIKKNPVSILIDDRYMGIHKCINRIIYDYGERYGITYGNRLNQKIIAETGELFLLSSPTMFYELFTITDKETDKVGLIESLHNVYVKYKEFYNDSIKGTLEFQEFRWPYDITVPDFSTKDTLLYTTLYGFTLDDECKLQSIDSQYRCLGDYRTPVKYTLTYDIVEKLAELLCQSDIEEYKKLLNTMNPNDRYYESVVNGGAKCADNMERLLRKVCK